MKKAVSFCLCLLYLLTILLPAGTLLSNYFGYNFELGSVPAVLVAIIVLSVCTVALAPKFIGDIENKFICVLLAILVPLSLVNAVFFIFECSEVWVIVCTLVSAGCCCFLTINYGRPVVLKLVALMVSALMILPIGFLSFLVLVFGNFGQNTVIQTVESPNGKYYAQVVDSDQGALGGNTFVDVYERSAFNAVVFKIQKKPQRLYSGEWGEFREMQIHWKNDDCLIIDSVEYEIE